MSYDPYRVDLTREQAEALLRLAARTRRVSPEARALDEVCRKLRGQLDLDDRLAKGQMMKVRP